MKKIIVMGCTVMMLLHAGCAPAASASVPAETVPAETPSATPASVIWKVVPSFDYMSVKEVTGSIDENYYGMKGYRKDIVAVSQDGIHYGIADDTGKVLIAPKYTTFDDKSYSIIGYGKEALLLGTESTGDTMHSPSTMDEINTDMEVNTVAFPSQIGGAIGPVLLYREDGTICYTSGKQADATFIDSSVSGYQIFPSYEDPEKTVILKDGQVTAAVNHQLIYESPSYLRYPIVNGYVMYADRDCARIPTAEVKSEFSYGSWIPQGCRYQDFDGMNDGVKFGFYDLTGKEITQAVYEDAYYFTDGYAAVSKDGKYGYIDTDGKEAVPMIFEEALPLYEGKAWVKVNGKWGILDLQATLKAGIPVTAETIQAE